MIITQIGLIVFIIISVESIKIFNTKNLFKKYIQAFNDLIKSFFNSQITDEIKQKKILEYSKILLVVSLKIIFLISIIIFLAMIIYYFDNNFVEFLFSLIGIIETLILLFLYMYLRQKK
tara:strand:+ start:72 stop:428 length:357 start_codon:yes stop_codon:yes gene_type:complete